MTAPNVIAVDLSAESGRVVIGRFDGARILLDEVNRFPSTPRHHAEHLRSDLVCLWSYIRTGMAAASERIGTIDALGVDSWGADDGLVDRAVPCSAIRSATAISGRAPWSPRRLPGKDGRRAPEEPRADLTENESPGERP